MHYGVTLYSNIGTIYSAKKDFDGAIEWFDTALKLQKALEYKHPRTAITLYNIGESRYQTNQDNKHINALEDFKTAKDIGRQLLGRYDLVCAHAIKGEALVYFDIAGKRWQAWHKGKRVEAELKKSYLDHLDKSIELHEEAWEIYKSSSTASRDDKIKQLCNLGVAYAAKDLEKALHYFSEAEAIIDDIGSSQGQLSQVRLWKDFFSQKGLAYNQAGNNASSNQVKIKQYEESKKCYESALTEWREYLDRYPTEEAEDESWFRCHQVGAAALWWGESYSADKSGKMPSEARLFKQKITDAIVALAPALKYQVCKKKHEETDKINKALKKLIGKRR